MFRCERGGVSKMFYGVHVFAFRFIIKFEMLRGTPSFLFESFTHTTTHTYTYMSKPNACGSQNICIDVACDRDRGLEGHFGFNRDIHFEWYIGITNIDTVPIFISIFIYYIFVPKAASKINFSSEVVVGTVLVSNAYITRCYILK
jgi:hypothetical protein